MFLNFEDEEKELEHQYQIIAALEIIDYKINTTNKTEQDLGLLMPLFEEEYDLGAYGYIGVNGTKIIIIKKMISFEEEGENNSIKGIFQGIYNAYSKLIMNPFFDREELNDTEKQSKIKNNFLFLLTSLSNMHTNFMSFFVWSLYVAILYNLIIIKFI